MPLQIEEKSLYYDEAENADKGVFMRYQLLAVILVAMLVTSSCSELTSVQGQDDDDVQYDFTRFNPVRGDVNLDGDNDVSDLTLMIDQKYSYQDGFTINPELQWIASDINADRYCLRLGDIQYMFYIMFSGYHPYPKEVVREITPKTVYYSHTSDGIFSIRREVLIGSLFLIARGEVTAEAVWEFGDHGMGYGSFGQNTLITISPNDRGCQNAYTGPFTGDLLQFTGEILYLELDDPEGNPLEALNVDPRVELPPTNFGGPIIH